MQLILFTKARRRFGQFISRLVLAEQGIISTHLKEGKRGMRVYPPWDLPQTNKHKKATMAVALLLNSINNL
jgi:hypothetical protein